MHSYEIIAKEDDLSQDFAARLARCLNTRLTRNADHPDLVITIGGDGTMLDAVHKYQDDLDDILFVGMHTGHLGFYSDYDKEDYEKLARGILHGDYETDERSLICVEGYGLALNEVRLEENHTTMVCDVYINGEFLERFRGNGLCVSTPSGSTAYNRSLGGAIIAASLPSLQLSEIAGIHHNAYRSLQSSLILDAKSEIRLEPVPSRGMILGLDRETIPYHDGAPLTLRVSGHTVRFAHFHQVHLVDRLRRAFINER